MKALFALLLLLPSSCLAADAALEAGPTLTLAQTERLHREASAFTDVLLKRLAANGTELKRLPSGFRSRVYSTAFEAARWAPEHFVAFAALAPKMTPEDWKPVFAAVADGPQTLTALVRARVEEAGAAPKVPTMDYERRDDPEWVGKVYVDGDTVDVRSGAPTAAAADARLRDSKAAPASLQKER
ncbi:MAG: hypothetical protein WC969_15140 [Elusimicrobiota bacterium]